MRNDRKLAIIAQWNRIVDSCTHTACVSGCSCFTRKRHLTTQLTEICVSYWERPACDKEYKAVNLNIMMVLLTSRFMDQIQLMSCDCYSTVVSSTVWTLTAKDMNPHHHVTDFPMLLPAMELRGAY